MRTKRTAGRRELAPPAMVLILFVALSWPRVGFSQGGANRETGEPKKESSGGSASGAAGVPGSAETSSPRSGDTSGKSGSAEGPSPAPEGRVPPAAPPALPQTPVSDTPLPPDKYFQLVLEKQQLEIEGLRRKSKIIDENRHDPAALMKALKQHDKEQVKKREELFKQYGTTAEAYYRSYRGTQVQKDRAHYLDANPKIRDQIAANSKTLRRLEAEVWDKLLPFLGPQSLTPSVKKNRP